MRKQYNQLPHVAFSILLALSEKERHGYDIIQQIHEDSLGRIKLSPGALYASIQQLHENGYIREIEKNQTDTRRRYYGLTDTGVEALKKEIDYYQNSLYLAKERQKQREKYA